MKVTDVREANAEIVETDSGQWRTYKRFNANCWDVLMGVSWEAVYFGDAIAELEAAYQKFKKYERRGEKC